MNELDHTFFTMAPEAADYHYTTTLETFEFKGQEWREVYIDAPLYQRTYQCGRYWSFLHGVTQSNDPRQQGETLLFPL